ncbi:MAG: energy-coupling factor transporter transmembrane protein EcfT [Clostridiales bacterium]|jgi:hypothetical protein|nr:energy-coupling factor transporter transmembrane protein EcfT [Clostridiales bacterium]
MVYNSKKAPFNPNSATVPDGEAFAEFSAARLSSKNAPVIFANASLLAVYLIAFISMLAGGFNTAVLVFTIFLIVITALHLLTACRTNFRFSYSRAGSVLYIIFSLIFNLVCMFAGFGLASGRHTFTVGGFLTVTAVYLSFIAILIYSLAYARAPVHKTRIGAIAVIALATAGVIGFSLYNMTVGYFGQSDGVGHGERAVVYKREGDFYAAVDCVNGGGDSIVVRDKFNGRDVTSIDCKLFSKQGIDRVTIEGTESVAFRNPETLNGINPYITIYVAYERVDEYKASLYTDPAYADAVSDESISYFFDALVPIIDYNSEIYLTFTYNKDKTPTGLSFIPTFKAPKGTEFTADDLPETYRPYFDNQSDLEWAWHTPAKLALRDLIYTAPGVSASLIGEPGFPTPIEYPAKIDAAFDTVYDLAMDKNDDLYPAPADWKAVNYMSESRIPFNLSTSRPGCEASWEIAAVGASVWKDIGNDSALLKDYVAKAAEPSYKLRAKWRVIAPVINELKSNHANDTFTYGEDVILSAVPASHALIAGFSYSVGYNGFTAATGSAAEINLGALLPDIITYTCTVRATDGFNPALYAEASKTIMVTVNKKALSFGWVLPADLEYNADDKQISCTFDEAQLVGSDSLQYGSDYKISGDTARDAGAYASAIIIMGYYADLYTVAADSQSVQFTVTKKSVTATWSGTALTYSGAAQTPSSSAVGVGADGALAITVTGGQTDAGTYTATAVADNGNYTLSNPTAGFTISPLSVNVTWADTVLTYNGAVQTPSASATGVGGINIPLTVSGGQTNAAAANDATASITDDLQRVNYALSNPETGFTISPLSVNVTWTNTSLTYNGAVQTPSASAVGVGGVNIPVTVSGGQTNVGSGYTASAGVTDSNYGLNNPTSAFAITKRSVAVNWGATSVVYNGEEQAPSASAVGAGADGALVIAVAASGGHISAGSYTATASLTDGQQNANYTLSNPTVDFTVTPLAVAVVWGNTSFTYNGAVQVPSASAQGIGVGVVVTVSGGQTNAGIYTATGSASNANYTLTNASVQFTVSPKEIDVVWDAATTVFTYDGEEHKPAVTGTTGTVGGDTVTITVSGGQTEAGTYTATANCSDPNYVISAATKSKSFTIT